MDAVIQQRNKLRGKRSFQPMQCKALCFYSWLAAIRDDKLQKQLQRVEGNYKAALGESKARALLRRMDKMDLSLLCAYFAWWHAAARGASESRRRALRDVARTKYAHMQVDRIATHHRTLLQAELFIVWTSLMLERRASRFEAAAAQRCNAMKEVMLVHARTTALRLGKQISWTLLARFIAAWQLITLITLQAASERTVRARMATRHRCYIIGLRNLILQLRCVCWWWHACRTKPRAAPMPTVEHVVVHNSGSSALLATIKRPMSASRCPPRPYVREGTTSVVVRPASAGVTRPHVSIVRLENDADKQQWAMEGNYQYYSNSDDLQATTNSNAVIAAAAELVSRDRPLSAGAVRYGFGAPGDR